MTQLVKPSRLLSNMPSLFSSLFDDDWFDGDHHWLARVPAANIQEHDDAFRIELAAPGMKKQDFHIDVDQGRLTIRSEKREETKEEKEHYTRQEFSYRSFSRSFVLPDVVKADDIQAKYEGGVLQLTLPKKENARKTLKKEIAIH
uniref:Hsp20/alpha crystallin family protein n=1 Tax=Roseihalotalea indica TaxID=2867963 RepID=A0AA49GJ27_9BACT|nr:Hsp20/alpha crystallin family protein [Tunicatimonas sp. TK19036]